MRRFKRLSRYQLINWAFIEAKRMQKLTDASSVVADHVNFLLDNYKPLLVVEVMRVWVFLREVEVKFSNLHWRNTFDRFHDECGDLVLDRKTDISSIACSSFTKMQLITRTRGVNLRRQELRTELERQLEEIQRLLDEKKSKENS